MRYKPNETLEKIRGTWSESWYINKTYDGDVPDKKRDQYIKNEIYYLLLLLDDNTNIRIETVSSNWNKMLKKSGCLNKCRKNTPAAILTVTKLFYDFYRFYQNDDKCIESPDVYPFWNKSLADGTCILSDLFPISYFVSKDLHEWFLELLQYTIAGCQKEYCARALYPLNFLREMYSQNPFHTNNAIQSLLLFKKLFCDVQDAKPESPIIKILYKMQVLSNIQNETCLVKNSDKMLSEFQMELNAAQYGSSWRKECAQFNRKADALVAPEKSLKKMKKLENEWHNTEIFNICSTFQLDKTTDSLLRDAWIGYTFQDPMAPKLNIEEYLQWQLDGNKLLTIKILKFFEDRLPVPNMIGFKKDRMLLEKHQDRLTQVRSNAIFLPIKQYCEDWIEEGEVSDLFESAYLEKWENFKKTADFEDAFKNLCKQGHKLEVAACFLLIYLAAGQLQYDERMENIKHYKQLLSANKARKRFLNHTKDTGL